MEFIKDENKRNFKTIQELIAYLIGTNQKFKIKYYPKSKIPQTVYTYGKPYYYNSEWKEWTQ